MLAFAVALGYTIRSRTIPSGDTSMTPLPSISAPTVTPLLPPIALEKPVAAAAEISEAGAEPAATRDAGAATATVQAPAPKPAAPGAVVTPRPSAPLEKVLAPKRDEKAAAAKTHDDKPAAVDTKANDPLDGRR